MTLDKEAVFKSFAHHIILFIPILFLEQEHMLMCFD